MVSTYILERVLEKYLHSEDAEVRLLTDAFCSAIDVIEFFVLKRLDSIGWSPRWFPRFVYPTSIWKMFYNLVMFAKWYYTILLRLRAYAMRIPFMYYGYCLIYKWLKLCRDLVILNKPLRSWLLDRHARRDNTLLSENIIRNLDLAVMTREIEGHPHPQAALTRGAANNAIENAVRTSGYIPYPVSRSRREADTGSRIYYVDKDMVLPYSNNPVTKNNVITMIDVDYYADMDAWLSIGQPILLYTFFPEVTGDTTEDLAFNITSDTVNFQVSGGEKWAHKIWNWDTSFFSVHRPVLYVIKDYLFGNVGWSGLLKEMFQTTLVNVKTWHTTENRRVVLLTPVVTVPRWCSIIYPPTRSLERVKYSHDGYNAIKIVRNNHTFINLSSEGQHWSVDITEALYYSIQSRKFHAKTYKNPGDVERALSESEYVIHGSKAKATAAMLLYNVVERDDIHIIHPAPNIRSTTLKEFITRDIPPHYQVDGDLKLEDGKSYARNFGPAIITLAPMVPAGSVNNSTACITGRVNDVRNKRRPQGRFDGYANEFIELIVPTPHIGAPKSIAEVDELQDRPSQRSRSNQARFWSFLSDHFKVQAFQKKESYGKITHPRNISTVPTQHTLKLSGFSLSMKEDCLKRFPWFSPAKTPVEMSAQVMVSAKYADEHGCKIQCGDYSRFDGTISTWLMQKVEHAVYLRWVDHEHYQELAILLNAELKSKAVTSDNVHYDPGSSRRSGSPLTSDGNTMMNAFVAYSAYRDDNIDKQRAADLLTKCNFYGDDSIIVGVEASKLELVAKYLGLTLKVESIDPGQPVPYLGRFFIDPTTSNISMQDPKRTMQKIGMTTASRGIELNIAATNRCEGYLSLEPGLPIITTYCERVIEHFQTEINPNVLGIMERQSLAADRPYYATDGWPVFRKIGGDYDVQAYEYMSKILSAQGKRNIGVDVIVDFDRDLRAACFDLHEHTELCKVIKPLDFGVVPVEVPAMLDGELLQPPQPVVTKTLTGNCTIAPAKVNKPKNKNREDKLDGETTKQAKSSSVIGEGSNQPGGSPRTGGANAPHRRGGKPGWRGSTTSRGRGASTRTSDAINDRTKVSTGTYSSYGRPTRGRGRGSTGRGTGYTRLQQSDKRSESESAANHRSDERSDEPQVQQHLEALP